MSSRRPTNLKLVNCILYDSARVCSVYFARVTIFAIRQKKKRKNQQQYPAVQVNHKDAGDGRQGSHRHFFTPPRCRVSAKLCIFRPVVWDRGSGHNTMLFGKTKNKPFIILKCRCIGTLYRLLYGIDNYINCIGLRAMRPLPSGVVCE